VVRRVRVDDGRVAGADRSPTTNQQSGATRRVAPRRDFAALTVRRMEAAEVFRRASGRSTW
jgi:hypothetical protein